MPNDTKIGKASYMLKRLRDCGYKADKILGVSDPVSLAKSFEELLDKLFPEGRTFTDVEVKKTIKSFKTEMIRFMNVCPDYNSRDARVWTILIDGGRDNIFLTYYKNFKNVDEKYEEESNDYFELYDGGQYVKPLRLRLQTSSVEIIVEHLTEMGITKKFSD